MSDFEFGERVRVISSDWQFSGKVGTFVGSSAGFLGVAFGDFGPREVYFYPNEIEASSE